MTKQHFEVFAREIREAHQNEHITIEQAKVTARIIANVARAFNPRFSEDRFFNAAGLSNVEEL